MPASTGATTRNPNPSSMADGCTGLAAACSAARARSTPCATRAATVSTMTSGRRSVPTAGTMRACSRIFARPKTRRGARASITASAGRCRSRTSSFRNPLSATFVEAAVQCGLRRNPDFNGAVQDGVGFYQVTQRRGRRCSAAVAYLRPAARRANLKVLTRCLSTRVLFEGRCAVGVEYRSGGALERARAEGEVILAAGTIGSAQLLLLSGVGPAGRAARARHRDAGRQPGGGAKFAGSSRFLHLEQVHGKDQLRFQRLPGAHRRGALPADAFGTRRQQHCRSGRFPAQPSGAGPASRHSIPLRARAARRPRAQSLKRARLHAARLRAAPVEPRTPRAQIRAAAGAAAHLRFLSERSEGP